MPKIVYKNKPPFINIMTNTNLERIPDQNDPFCEIFVEKLLWIEQSV